MTPPTLPATPLFPARIEGVNLKAFVPIVTPAEWTGTVDMRSRPDAKWEIWTWLPTDNLSLLTQAMARKALFDYFVIDTKEMDFPNDDMTRVRLFLQQGNSQYDFGATRILCRIIRTLEYRICWKENGMGYDIDAHGHISRKWALTKIKASL